MNNSLSLLTPLPFAGLVVAIAITLASFPPAMADELPQVAPQTESCVLLRNGNVLVGAVTKIGGTVCITRSDQSKINLPSAQVETVGRSLSELYEYRRKNRFEGDLKRVQADVRWGLRHGLVREAAQDVLEARSLEPSNPQTIQLLRQIAAMLKQQSEPAKPPAADDQQTPALRMVSHETVVTDDRRDVEPETAAESSGLPERLVYEFTSRIQPILMNRCTSCHARDDRNTHEFQIHTALTSKWAPKDVARDNLQAVMKYVDLNAPANSLIRLRASDGHGGRRHTFGSQGSAMMSNLDRWLAQLPSAHSPSQWEAAMEQSAGAEPLVPASPPQLAAIDQVGQAASATGIPELPETLQTESVWNAGPPMTEAAPRTRRMPKVENPFDPDIFNRRVHGR
ncbi:hypothetical protein [Planctomycetes bacterium TBK1r]|uniref:Planctomycete cytochrome C n=1 Tax=Stieleria magnilauensis TaxID=2527963 RepID=A0ABX5XM24_9BACT|nr:hypothetical protein TBK1r_13600 [Planctomycetes bacterium TBK1r]